MGWRADSETPDSPFEQFKIWYERALTSDCPEPTAMCLSTVSSAGRPSSRMLLLKHYDRDGFRFATNHDSRKAQELESSGQACLLFHWASLHRQIRVEGRVERAPASESDAIFARRPRGARLGAWASSQSRPLSSRKELMERVAHFDRIYPDDVPRPPHWGAFLLRPDYFEFWEGREDRLHMRLSFSRASTNWIRTLLAP